MFPTFVIGMVVGGVVKSAYDKGKFDGAIKMIRKLPLVPDGEPEGEAAGASA